MENYYGNTLYLSLFSTSASSDDVMQDKGTIDAMLDIITIEALISYQN